ncbi:MAG: hypothetical protein JWM77_1239 [Rhodospirillales bacterium]|nr:hypothetical protein [Rhodospirillales bacterium]
MRPDNEPLRSPSTFAAFAFMKVATRLTRTRISASVRRGAKIDERLR